MKTHNASIYHCISCGRIEHGESEVEALQCCGHAMVRACAETFRYGDAAGEKAGDDSETALTVIKGSKKPR